MYKELRLLNIQTHITKTYNKISIRNFNLYKILTPIDVREVFHIMQERWRSEQIANQKLAFVLTFDGFVEMLVRLALVAYNKRGLKRIISSIKGRNSMPTNRDIVQYFCHFLHLDDEAYVDNIILTVGRATQGDINYRSASETSTRIRDQLQEDVSKKRMMNDENQLMGESKYSDSSSVHLRSPISPVSKHIASSSSSVATGHSRILKSDPYKDSRLPSELLEKLEGSSKYGGNYDEMTESGYRYDGDQSLYTTGSSLAETNDIYEASCERIFAESYDSSLLNLLKCYRISSGQCYINTSTTCKGPYIDMGVLRAGNKYVIEIKLTNKKASKVSIDVTSAGLDSSKIVTHPAPIISGFSRKVYVMFCANSNDINRSSCYASIHITAGSQELTCPVCFTVRNE